ncbi:MAG: ATP-binding protein [Saprospiraceae bacterium]
MQPYNFPYFITLFSIALAGACYLYFSFHRTWIIWGNILLFVLGAVRVATEYAIHQIESFELANILATFHSMVAFTMGIFLWVCTYFYIRPLRNWRYERKFHSILMLLITVLSSIHFYSLYYRLPYQLITEKVDEKWTYIAMTGSLALTYINALTLVFSFIIVLLFATDIIRTRRKMLFKTVLTLSYLIVPTFFISFVHNTEQQVPNAGFIFLSQIVIVSWFCSDYRLFRNTFSTAIQDILNSVADLTIYTNLQLNIQFANTATHELFTQKSALTTIHNVLAHYSTESIGVVKQQIIQLIQEQIDKHEIEINISGRKYYLVIQSEPFYRSNQHIGYIFIMNNVTELRHNQELLKYSNQTKDQLFAIIGHDLRKPTLAFRGISSKINHLLARDDFRSLQQLGKHWESAANSLNHLVDNLLKWAMQQRNIMPYTPERIELSLALLDSIEPLQNMLDDKNIKLTVGIPDNMQVLADFNALLTIMRNILDNAIKFTPENGQIVVEAKAISEGVHISISDSGIGMNDEQINELFTIRKGKSRKGTAGESGTGIGLSLVKELVQTNQGKLSVTSQPNQGTTINIILPNSA